MNILHYCVSGKNLAGHIQFLNQEFGGKTHPGLLELCSLESVPVPITCSITFFDMKFMLKKLGFYIMNNLQSKN